MDLTLTRLFKQEDGIFSRLTDEMDSLIAMTLEHAYETSPGYYDAKIQNGIYVCRRGMHKLKSSVHSFETFQVLDIPGHTNILFHIGNVNNDSEGCILLGDNIVNSGSKHLITNSKKTFDKFMLIETGECEFKLTVKG